MAFALMVDAIVKPSRRWPCSEAPADLPSRLRLLADGFSIDQLAGLVVEGHAVMQRRRVEISGRMRTVVGMQITEAGRKAIAQ
jgi:hypothetical protein